MADYFEIVSQTEYLIEINPIENIEDCGDEFLTKEELEEMGLGTYFYGNCKRLLESKVKSVLASYLAKIPKDKKSIIVREDDLIDALKETETPVSDIIPNTRRVGNRLFKHTKAEKVRNALVYRDWTNLLNLIEAYGRSFEVYTDIKRSDSNRVNAITLFKKLATFEELKTTYENGNSGYQTFDEDDYVWMEKLYNDPSLAPQVKKKK